MSKFFEGQRPLLTFLCLQIILMPLYAYVIAQPAQAQDTTTSMPDVVTQTDNSLTSDQAALSDSEDDEPQLSDDDIKSLDAAITDDPLADIDLLQWATDSAGQLVISPQDLNQITDYNVDTRVTDYLLYLTEPIDQGGAGFDYIKVNRIFKNYDSDGVGQFDREGSAAANPDENDTTISAHHLGEAVDISAVGELTCKVVEKRHGVVGIGGGDTTHWQKPVPIEVAWQSRDGISKSPTPTGNSLVGIGSNMSANAILQFLNDSGEMDQYVDYVKGLDLSTILTYVGANIYLKNLGVSKIVSDPLADSMIHVVGGVILEKNLPSLPPGISSGNNDDDARVAFAKAQIEQGLGLPPGSLRGYGWNAALQNVGKRELEEAFGLPALFLDDHTLKDANNLDKVKSVLHSFQRRDATLNMITGTLDKFEGNDTQSFKMAGVNILADSLKLSNQQRSLLESAARSNKDPDIVLDGSPTGSVISTEDLKNFLSSDPQKQKQAEASLKEQGISLIQEGLKKVVPNKYQGLTSQLLNQLGSPSSTPKLGDIKQSLGEAAVANDSNVAPTGNSQTPSLNGGKDNKINSTVADSINKQFKLTGGGQITADEVQGGYKRGDFSVFKKIAAAEADKAAGWNPGTGLAIINNQKNMADVASEMFSNSISQMLGLGVTGVSLKGDTAQNFGSAIAEQRLGFDKNSLINSNNANDVYQQVGQNKFYGAFRIDTNRSLTELQADDNYWAQEDVKNNLNQVDIKLNAVPGTAEAYLRGSLDSKSFSKRLADNNLKTIGANELSNYFGLEQKYQLDPAEVINLINAIRGKQTVVDPKTGKTTETDVTFENNQKALATIYKLMGRVVSNHSQFSVDALATFFTGTEEQRSTLLLDQGIRLFISAVGVRSNASDDDINAALGALHTIFNNPAGAFDISLVVARNLLTSYVQKSAGIPDDYSRDAVAITEGKMAPVMTALSYDVWSKNINSYLPDNDKLTYPELRNGFIFDDQSTIDARAKSDFQTGTAGQGNYDSLDSASKTNLSENARREIMEEARRHAEYKVSDSLLRKTDKTIPVGFTETMFSGSAADRGKLIETWGINHIETYLAQADPSYKPGMLQEAINGTASEKQNVAITAALNHLPIDLGPFNKGFIISFATFAQANQADKANYFSDPKYASMWSTFDNWLGTSINVSGLPAGISQSVYYASQHGWDLNAGTDKIASLSKIGEDVLVNKLSSWGDTTLHLPAGKVYETYKAVKAVADASRALAATNTTSSYSSASSNLSKAQKGLWLLAISTALTACAACQQAFAAVDQAIAAPPGFTNALATGIIAMSLGMGPAGLIAAAAIYFFGVYEVDYLCPIPPPDQFADPTFDQANDQLNYSWGNYYSDPTHQVSTGPAPGQNPFDWQGSVQFADGNNQNLWMAWARYQTGKLLQYTMLYGAIQDQRNKPKQVITYRRANAEFFSADGPLTFGLDELTDPTIGLGYSETTTKTTDWVHVAFGGLL